MAFCNKCGAELIDGSVFCRKCGAKQAPVEPQKKFCVKCGAELEPNSAFCRKCGARAADESSSVGYAQVSPQFVQNYPQNTQNYPQYVHSEPQAVGVPYQMPGSGVNNFTRGMVDPRMFEGLSEDVRVNCIKLNENAHKCRAVKQIRMCKDRNGNAAPVILGNIGMYRIGCFKESRLEHIRLLSDFNTGIKKVPYVLSVIIRAVFIYGMSVMVGVLVGMSLGYDTDNHYVSITIAVLAAEIVFSIVGSAVWAAVVKKETRTVITFIYETIKYKGEPSDFDDVFKYETWEWIGICLAPIGLTFAIPMGIRLKSLYDIWQ